LFNRTPDYESVAGVKAKLYVFTVSELDLGA
jgi:hypothetical protein